MVSVNYEIEANVEQKTVYYTGADAISDGMLLAYDRDSITGVRGDSQAATAFGMSRYRKVEKLTLANIADFAGVVKEGGGCAARTDGGLSQVTIIVPKDGIAVNVHCFLSCTINATILHPVPGQYYAGVGSSLSPWAFKALQTVDRSSTAGLVECVFIRSGAGEAEINPYIVDTVQMFAIGQKYEDPADGRIFRYCKSNAVCRTGRLAAFGGAIPATGIDYSALAAVAAIGATSVQMTNQGVVSQTLDCLAGGMIFISDEDDDTPIDGKLQQRRITGNTAGGVNAVITIYLDRPLVRAVTTATYAFCMPSPFSSVGHDEGGSKKSVAGLPAAYVSATGMHFWAQRRGLCWIAPQNAVGKTAYAREIVARHDGSIDDHEYNDVVVSQGQHVGYIVDNNTADNGGTMFWLDLE